MAQYGSVWFYTGGIRISAVRVCSRIYFFLCAIWSGAWPILNARRLTFWNRSKKSVQKIVYFLLRNRIFRYSSPNVRQNSQNVRQILAVITIRLYYWPPVDAQVSARTLRGRCTLWPLGEPRPARGSQPPPNAAGDPKVGSRASPNSLKLGGSVFS